MKLHLDVMAGCLAALSTAAAQEKSAVRLELRPFAGMYVPAGGMADDFKSSSLFGIQPALELNQNFHVLGTFGWSDARSKIGALTNDQAYLWQYDLGVEANAFKEIGEGWLFRPFVGAGAGARTYEYKDVGVGNKTCTAGYGALGTEFQKLALALRIESRGYVNCFTQPLTGKKLTRADMTFAAGFAYHLF
jgi:hypothetical protein